MSKAHERDALLEALRGLGRTHIEFDDLLRAVQPVWLGAHSSEPHQAWLRDHLDALVEAGELALPRQRRLWRPGNPNLPQWVRLVREPQGESARDIRGSEHWLPIMAFARQLRDRRQLERARTINRYLKSRPALSPALPLRERSLEIFGDEKELDRCRITGHALFGGELDLDKIGAFQVPWPIPYERSPDKAIGRPILVVENHHTYFSLARWNERSGRYAAVAYGSGNALSGASGIGSSAGESYIDIMRARFKAEIVEYFGDLDPEGIRIPDTLDRARREQGLPGLEPARVLYAWLLDNGHRGGPIKGNTPAIREAVNRWFDTVLAGRIERLFDSGERIAQEALTYRDMLSL